MKELNNMKVILNDNEEFDFSLSEFEIKFPTDGVHHPAELNAYKILQLFVDGKVEIKDHNKAMHTTNLFIEYKLDKRGDGKIEGTGLRTTKADFWLFNMGKSLIIVETNFLKFCFNNRKDKLFNLRTADNKYEKNHIGYGMLIPIAKLPYLLGKYEDYIKSR